MVAAAAIGPVGRARAEAAIIRTRPAIKGTENRTTRPWMRARVISDPRVLIFVVGITVQTIRNNMWSIGGVRRMICPVLYLKDFHINPIPEKRLVVEDELLRPEE